MKNGYALRHANEYFQLSKFRTHGRAHCASAGLAGQKPVSSKLLKTKQSLGDMFDQCSIR